VPEPHDPFDRVHGEPNPIRRAKLAADLIATYQQRSAELARLRKEAINQAAAELGLSFSTIAKELGLTRGRITQIRQTAPPVERIFFGVGPVTVAVPLRDVPGRALPVISSEDSRSSDLLSRLLSDLAFQVEHFHIPPDGNWQPPDDAVAICGPKNSSVSAEAIASDPFLRFEPDQTGKWAIFERDGNRVYESAMDDATSKGWSDVAYVGRLSMPGRDGTLLVIAGVHALGSIGAVDYLSRNLPELYAKVGTKRFSMVVGSEHDDGTVTRSELLCDPRVHP
jgi:hypothetical protein